MTNIAHPAPPDPAVVLAYAARHGTTAAAERFKVNPRTVRKWRTRYRPGPEAPVQPTRTAQDGPRPAPPLSPRGRVYAAPIDPSAPVATVGPDAVANGDELWRCPICRELMPPLPGTTGAAWAAAGCYMHTAQPADPVDHNEAAPAQPPAQEATRGPAPAPADTASQPEESPGPARLVIVQGDPDPARPSAPAPIIVRQVIRVPIARRRRGLIGWAYEHELIGPGPALALVIFAVLMLMISL